MSKIDHKNRPVYRYGFTVPDDVVDQNGHVNNVVYVQWMQDVALLHSDIVGGTRAMEAAGGTWVVRSHRVEYLRPAFAGDQVEAFTWVVNFRRVRSLRRYKFVRITDNTVLAKGETEWVFVDGGTGRPRAIPGDVMRVFPVMSEYQDL
ncbi:MAG: thioesterase family protein [Thermodesulfobacteriota bacterium]|nr:thioesterase family protein [Thermodesulfobacteriota bacterium]